MHLVLASMQQRSLIALREEQFVLRMNSLVRNFMS